MAETITLSDIRNQVSDFAQNYNTSNIDLGNTDRAINRAIEYVQRRLGLPSDRKVYSFYYYDDIMFYDMPDAFNELMQLYYNTTDLVDINHNTPFYRWGVVKDVEILRSSGFINQGNRVAFTTLNGSNQLLLDGMNIRGSSTVNSFDTTTGLTFSADFLNTTTDPYIKKQGSASVKFDLTTGLSESTITFSDQLDISNLLNINTAYRLWVFFPTAAPTKFTNVKIRFISSTGNYYEVTTTTQFDGSAWTANDWNKLSWSLSNATTTGSPDATNISSIQIAFTHSGSYSAITNMRVDFLYQVNPDYMDVLYYSAIKGTDSTGATDKIILDESDDIVAFGPYAPDLILPIALKAATILWPQLRADLNFLMVYKQDCEETLKLFGRTYPRQRSMNSGQTQILR